MALIAPVSKLRLYPFVFFVSFVHFVLELGFPLPLRRLCSSAKSVDSTPVPPRLAHQQGIAEPANVNGNGHRSAAFPPSISWPSLPAANGRGAGQAEPILGSGAAPAGGAPRHGRPGGRHPQGRPPPPGGGNESSGTTPRSHRQSSRGRVVAGPACPRARENRQAHGKKLNVGARVKSPVEILFHFSSVRANVARDVSVRVFITTDPENLWLK